MRKDQVRRGVGANTGLRGGNPAWVKGVSGNPGGRTKLTCEVQKLAQENGPEAIRTLVRALQDPKQCVGAAIALLDRGFGRPRQQIDATVREIAGGIDVPERPTTVENAEEWLARRREELASLRKLN